MDEERASIQHVLVLRRIGTRGCERTDPHVSEAVAAKTLAKLAAMEAAKGLSKPVIAQCRRVGVLHPSR